MNNFFTTIIQWYLNIVSFESHKSADDDLRTRDMQLYTNKHLTVYLQHPLKFFLEVETQIHNTLPQRSLSDNAVSCVELFHVSESYKNLSVE